MGGWCLESSRGGGYHSILQDAAFKEMTAHSYLDHHHQFSFVHRSLYHRTYVLAKCMLGPIDSVLLFQFQALIEDPSVDIPAYVHISQLPRLSFSGKKRLITPYGNQLLGLILCALDDAVSAMDQKATDAGLTMISTANGDMGLCFFTYRRKE
jgi:hypothetical protein